jgi:hypothetical protein
MRQCSDLPGVPIITLSLLRLLRILHLQHDYLHVLVEVGSPGDGSLEEVGLSQTHSHQGVGGQLVAVDLLAGQLGLQVGGVGVASGQDDLLVGLVCSENKEMLVYIHGPISLTAL